MQVVRLKLSKVVMLLLALIFVLSLCSCGKVPQSKLNVIADVDTSLQPLELLQKYDFKMFKSFGAAIDAVNSGTVSDAEDVDKELAVAGVYVGTADPYVLLIKDAAETDAVTLGRSMTINLGGNILSFTGCKLAFNCQAEHTDTIVIDGRLNGSEVTINGTNEAAGVLRTRTNKVFVLGGSFTARSDSEIAKVMGFYVDEGGVLEMADSDIDAISHYLYKSGAGYTASSIGIFNNGTAILNNCSVLGTHSGVQTYGSLEVDGGIYESFGHGGLYFCGANTSSYIKNATVRECEMPKGYTQTVAGNHAGLYIGGNGANGVKVYMDNCTIDATSQPVVMRGTGGEKNNHIYISNSTIPLGTYYGLRIDNSTHRVYIGSGNNFGIEELKIRDLSGVTEADLGLIVKLTDDVYRID